MLGLFGTVLGIQQPPVSEADAILWLWGSWLCRESGMALVESWSKVYHHHDTHCQQDKDGNDDGEQRQPILSRGFPGPTQHLQELPLGLLPS